MARVLITGSSDGLGLLAGRLLQGQGHRVTLHGRDPARAAAARAALPRCEGVVVGDVSRLDEMRRVAEQANASGRFDAVIHNVGIGYQEPRRTESPDGVELVFAVNVLAPYVLTALVRPPGRLVYLSSGMHRGGTPDLGDAQWKKRSWNGAQAYSDSKLWDVVLAFAVARRWPAVLSNAVDPGWVPTRMGGPSASGDLEQGAQTQVWLAVSDESGALVSGRYLYHRQPQAAHPAASDIGIQNGFLKACEELTGVRLASAVEKD